MPTVRDGFVQEVIGRYDGDPGMLIPMMQDLQAEYGYLPPEELKLLAKELGVPLSRVYGVAMFYASFRLSPKGRHEVTLCMGTVCHLKGAPRISEAICAEHSIQPGGTTADRLFTLQAVNCVGACALAPVMIVDGKYHAGVTPESALSALRELAAAAEEQEAAGPASAGAVEPTPPPVAEPRTEQAAAAGQPAGPSAVPQSGAPQSAEAPTPVDANPKLVIEAGPASFTGDGEPQAAKPKRRPKTAGAAKPKGAAKTAKGPSPKQAGAAGPKSKAPKRGTGGAKKPKKGGRK